MTSSAEQLTHGMKHMRLWWFTGPCTSASVWTLHSWSCRGQCWAAWTNINCRGRGLFVYVSDSCSLLSQMNDIYDVFGCLLRLFKRTLSRYFVVSWRTSERWNTTSAYLFRREQHEVTISNNFMSQIIVFSTNMWFQTSEKWGNKDPEQHLHRNTNTFKWLQVFTNTRKLTGLSQNNMLIDWGWGKQALVMIA